MSVSVSFVYNGQNYKFESNSTKSTFGQVIEFLYNNGYNFQGEIHKQPTRKLLTEEEYKKILSTTSYGSRNFYKIKDHPKYIISNYNSYLIEAFIKKMITQFGVEDSTIDTNGFDAKTTKIKPFSEFDDEIDDLNLDEDDLTPVEEPVTKIKVYKQNPFKQAICVLGESGAGKSVTIETILENEGHNFEFIIPTAATTGLLAQFSPSKSGYVPSRLGKMLMGASKNPQQLYTAVFDEMHKSNVIEMINDELLQAISTKRNRGRRFISLDDDTAEIYQDSDLDTERGNLLIPDNFGFIFISSKPRVIANNADFFNRVDIVLLKSYQEETIETTEQLLSNKLGDEEKMKLASTRND